MTYALVGATVLSEASGPSVEGVDVIIEGERIAAVGTAARDAFPGAELIDASRLLVVRGFVNAHTHSCESLRRGLAVEATLDAWLRAVWSGADSLSPDAIYLAVTLSAIEMLKGGTTAVLDHFRQRPMRSEALAAAKQAYEAVGLRATIALMLRDDPDDKTCGPRQDLDEQFELCVEHLAKRGLVSFAVGPSGPTRCSDELLDRANRTALTYGVPLHMHLDETSDQAHFARERHGGRTSVRRLADLGALGSHVSCAHAVWVTQDDIALLAATRTRVVHNPVSNLRLGSGRAPIGAFRRAGVSVGLGTDGAASNDGLDLLESAKAALLLSRLGPRDEWLGLGEALHMATDGGRVAPGMAADLAVIDLDSPAFVPLHDAAAQLVLGGRTVRIRHTFVAGRWVVRDGAIAGLDEASLYEEARWMFARAAA